MSNPCMVTPLYTGWVDLQTGSLLRACTSLTHYALSSHTTLRLHNNLHGCVQNPHALAGSTLPEHSPKPTQKRSPWQYSFRRTASPSHMRGCKTSCPGRQHPAGALAEADAEAVALAKRAQAHGIAVAQECALQARRQVDRPRAVARSLQQACRTAGLLHMAQIRTRNVVFAEADHSMEGRGSWWYWHIRSHSLHKQKERNGRRTL